jgi:uncharacterized protein
MTSWRGFTRALCALLAICSASPAVRADEGQHVFWEVSGSHNTVYLLGSVHVLHINDRELPSVTEAAYLDAEALVEELDLRAATGEILGADAMAQQMLPAGQTLAQVIGPELNAKLAAAAAQLHLDTDFMVRMQPWMVATMISQLRLAQAGYSARDGVDFQIAARAARDGKPVIGLETAVEQLQAIASMSMDDQRKFLASSLDETESGKELAEITDAWRHGDLARMEALLHKARSESPEFFDRIIVQRNRNWMPKLEAMLADPDKDYLVVVGAAHMIGRQGVVELLKKKGYVVKRR